MNKNTSLFSGFPVYGTAKVTAVVFLGFALLFLLMA